MDSCLATYCSEISQSSDSSQKSTCHISRNCSLVSTPNTHIYYGVVTMVMLPLVVHPLYPDTGTDRFYTDMKVAMLLLRAIGPRLHNVIATASSSYLEDVATGYHGAGLFHTLRKLKHL